MLRDTVSSGIRQRRNAAVIALAVGLSLAVGAQAQRRGGDGAQEAEERTPRELAPIDLTGYWVSVVTEDWRWRMVVPPQGDYSSVPLNDDGEAMADTWDPEQATDTCEAYGAAGIMRMPLRLHITWEDDETLRIDTDHGLQTRRLEFAGSGWQGGEPQWQGDSVATWEGSLRGRRQGGAGGGPSDAQGPGAGMGPGRGGRTVQLSNLKVVTTNMRPGYLRTNGVPYSGDTVLTEFFDRHSAYGDEWITVTTIVNDPAYLTEEFITSSSFKQLADGSSWNPRPCEAS